MARASVLKKSYDVETGVVTIQFLASQNELKVNLDSLKPEIVKQAALHGLAQKFGDAAAGAQGEEAEDAVNSVAEQVLAGQWNATREKGEQAPSVIAQAVFRFKEKMGKLNGETLEQIQARYAGKEGQKLRTEAQAHPKVAAIILEIQQERLDARKAKLAATDKPEADVDSL